MLINDEKGSLRLGGAYAWRDVTAPTPEDAVKIACAALLTDPAVEAEMCNENEMIVEITAEEVLQMSDHATDRSTSVVFYIDTEQN